MTYTNAEFKAFIQQHFGGHASNAAKALGVSQPTVSNIMNEKTSVSKNVQSRISAFLSSGAPMVTGQVQKVAPVKTEDGSYDFANTDLRGEASFRMELIARDLTSNKFVKAQNVNPALLFPEFAPAPQVVHVPFGQSGAPSQQFVEDETLTDEDILNRINQRINVMRRITQGVIDGSMPSLIVYGGPGMGKSHTIMADLKAATQDYYDFDYDLIKGSVTVPGLYEALFRARDGGVIVLDDSDAVFKDEETLNLLKAALDSSDERVISWRKQSGWLSKIAADYDVDVDEVRNFTFEGGVIFITNVNLPEKHRKGGAMSEHFGALISRSFFVDLTIDSPRARSVYARQVFLKGGMAEANGLTPVEAVEVMDYVHENRQKLAEISLRTVTRISKAFVSDRQGWKDIVEVTMMY